ncbi:MAG: hypothetical protein R2879_15285 [Saprospiraceae bacterium]
MSELEILDENQNPEEYSKPVFSILSTIGFVVFIGIQYYLITNLPSNLKANEKLKEHSEYLDFILPGILYLVPLFGALAIFRKEKPDWLTWTAVVIGGIFFLINIFYLALENLN